MKQAVVAVAGAVCLPSTSNPSYSLQLAHQVNGSAKRIGEYAWAGD
jgi:hypothetical protein